MKLTTQYYALGFKQGLASGVCEMPEGLTDCEQYTFNEGYQAGVTAYCDTLET
tara:strand:- start:1872 stop:2030 length:159 start_codon:yes stop_codon:yes gene_type:complete